MKPKPKASSAKGTPKPARPVVRAAAATGSSSPNALLLVGGLALVILVLGDTVFLSLSTRFLRQT